MQRRNGSEESEFIKHESCDNCGSSDGRALYTNGTAFCFACPDGKGWSVWKERDSTIEVEEEDGEFMDLTDIHKLPILALESRGISKEIATLFAVRTEINIHTGEAVAHYYPFYTNGIITAYKKRTLPKEFSMLGSTKGVSLFGEQLIGNGGQFIIVTEGQDDCLAAYQMLKSRGKSYRVVSVPNGAKSIKKHLEVLSKYHTIVLCFDGDDVGSAAATKAVELFEPGKAKVMTMRYKDANDYLLHDAATEFLQDINNAKARRPDGIVSLDSTWDSLWENQEEDSVPYPWDGVNELLYGLRKKELVTLTSGSGMGKSAVARELEHWLFKNTNDNIGILALEEDTNRTVKGIMSIEANKPLSIKEESEGVSKEEQRKYWEDTVGTGRFFAYDHFGSSDTSTLLNKVRYLIRGLDCKWIVLDHLSIIVSGQDNGDERKAIDHIMTELRSIVEETGVGMILISHLKRVSGDRGHEQGVEVSLSHLRGSQAIAQLSDAVIALERNQQSDDIQEANTTTVRVLKNRYAGLVGKAARLYYNRTTGRLEEVFDEEEEGDFV